MLRIEPASTPDQLDAVRSLFRAFVAWHRATHVADRHLIDRYFDAVAFEAELRDLPGAYAPPQGALLLGLVGEDAAGCVALRDLGDGVCEMKRMFVLPQYQRRGLGLSLAEQMIEAARRSGYRAMRLDTSKAQIAAIALYQRLGFQAIPPYAALPQEVVDWLVFLEKPL
jgi:ribosomal protein S18 acetylase RimI-like enzyme